MEKTDRKIRSAMLNCVGDIESARNDWVKEKQRYLTREKKSRNVSLENLKLTAKQVFFKFTVCDFLIIP